jgi:uncharacterized protein YcbX
LSGQRDSSSIQVSAITCYPIKSCAGISLSSASIGPRGIVHDREWMVITPDNCFLTQRERPCLALIHPEVAPDGSVMLRAAGQEPLLVPVRRQGHERCVAIWDDTCVAIDQGEKAATWLSAFLGLSCRLVHMADDFIRPVDPEYARRASDQVGFADGYPFLLISEASLTDLNSRLTTPLPMNRFRPNIVLSGCAPYVEDTWQRIRIDSIEFAVVKPCARCVITTTDQKTASIGKEPLKTLATYRNSRRGVLFGQNLIHASTGTIHIGASVTVIA